MMLVWIPAVNAEWVEGGIPVCIESSRQIDPQIVSDGARGAIITWADTRSGEGDIYAQRISPYGRLLWDAAGVAVCTEEDHQYPHHSISDCAGGAIIAWVDQEQHLYTRIAVQRLNGSGEVLWIGGGVVVCPVTASQDKPVLVTDGANGAIVVWEDYREGSIKIYAQRIDSYGNRQWDYEGIKVSDVTPHDHLLEVIPHDISGAIILWVGTSADEWTLYAQSITADGTLRWNNEVVVASKKFDGGARGIGHLFSVTDTNGGAIVTWYETRADYPPYRIYAQRIDENGVVRWASEGFLVYFTGLGCGGPRIAQDGNGGAIIVWEIWGGIEYWQYAQRMDSGGVNLWQERGVEVCYTANLQQDLRLTSNGTDGAISTWSEERTPGHYDIIAQRVDENGVFQWTAIGCRVSNVGGDQVSPALVPDGGGGAIIAWQDRREGSGQDRIYALRIDTGGDLPQGTRLQSYSAHGAGYDIIVEWILEQAGNNFDFSIFRAVAPDTAFRAITDPEIVNRGLTYTFIDRNREPATTYRYRVDITDDEGTKPFLVTDPVTTPPMPVTLYQNYPNPFNPQTTIYYYLPGPGRVTLEIYDVSGRWIFTVLDDWREMGHHGESWDGYGVNGEPLPSGVYFCRLKASMGSSGRKMILVR